MYYELISLIAGIVCKLYDDIYDNKRFRNYKNNKVLLETLKGLHFITFTIVSIKEPIFFYLNVIINVLHYISNSSSFLKPYENSLFYSLSIIFLLIDYTKIKWTFNITDILLFGSLCNMGFVEPFLIQKEISIYKLIHRIIGVSCLLLALFFVKYSSDAITYISIYFIGYFFISILVQYYSLFINKKPTKNPKKLKQMKQMKQMNQMKQPKKIEIK
jgi:hypothetical protein